MDIARQYIGGPQRDPGRVKKRLDVPAEIMGFPEYHTSMTFPVRLTVFSRHRSMSTILPSRIR
jgi:hypothetical protein